MRHRSALDDRTLATRDAFEECDALPQGFKRLDIDEVGARQAVLGDQNRLPVSLEFLEQRRRASLQCGDQLRPHASDTRVSLERARRRPRADFPAGNSRERTKPEVFDIDC